LGTDCKVQQVLRWIRKGGNVACIGGRKVYGKQEKGRAGVEGKFVTVTVT
jgi:hypothetical protein